MKISSIKKQRKLIPAKQVAHIFNIPDETDYDQTLLQKNIFDGDCTSGIILHSDPSHEIEIDILRANTCRKRGCELAENDRFPEALTCWLEGLLFHPQDFLLHELCAQAYLNLNLNFKAVKSSQVAVDLNPTWAEGRLTLARAQRELGEVEQSLNNYQIVFDRNDIDESMRNEVENEMKTLLPIVLKLREKQQEFMFRMQQSDDPDAKEVDSCMMNLSTRFDVR